MYMSAITHTNTIFSLFLPNDILVMAGIHGGGYTGEHLA